jgi:beta-aspartyl-peptidase (threonine type)
LLGCGLYADNEIGACSLTGDGESITRMVLGKRVLELLRDGREPDTAIKQALAAMNQRVGGTAGCILIDSQGQIGWEHNSPNLPCAYQHSGMNQALAFVSKAEAGAELDKE